jgi:hypothetical protein
MRAQSTQHIGVEFIVHFQDFGIEQMITTIHGEKMQEEKDQVDQTETKYEFHR